MAEAKTAPAPKPAGPKKNDGMLEFTTTKNDRSTTQEVFIGTDLASLCAKWGDENVYDHAVAHIKISIQGKIRRMLESEDPVYQEADFKKAAAEWTAGVKRIVAKSDADKAKELLDKLDPAARKALLAELAG